VEEEVRVDQCGRHIGEIGLPYYQGLTVSPSTLSFNQVGRGEAATLTFYVHSSFPCVMRIERVEVVEGDEDGEREIVPGAQWSSRFEIAPDEAPRMMTLEWRPVNEMRDTAKLRFKFKAPDAPGGVFEVEVTTPRLVW
jgi:hypothetical protein